MTTLLILLGYTVAFFGVSWLLNVPVDFDGLRFRQWWSECPLWAKPEE